MIEILAIGGLAALAGGTGYTIWRRHRSRLVARTRAGIGEGSRAAAPQGAGSGDAAGKDKPRRRTARKTNAAKRADPPAGKRLGSARGRGTKKTGRRGPEGLGSAQTEGTEK